MDAFGQHDIAASYTYSDRLNFYGGIKNVTAEDPFITDFGFPGSPRGRFFYVGVNYSMEGL